MMLNIAPWGISGRRPEALERADQAEGGGGERQESRVGVDGDGGLPGRPLVSGSGVASEVDGECSGDSDARLDGPVFESIRRFH